MSAWTVMATVLFPHLWRHTASVFHSIHSANLCCLVMLFTKTSPIPSVKRRCSWNVAALRQCSYSGPSSLWYLPPVTLRRLHHCTHHLGDRPSDGIPRSSAIFCSFGSSRLATTWQWRCFYTMHSLWSSKLSSVNLISYWIRDGPEHVATWWCGSLWWSGPPLRNIHIFYDSIS